MEKAKHMQNPDEESRNAHAGFIDSEKKRWEKKIRTSLARFFVAFRPAIPGGYLYICNVAHVSYFSIL